MTNPVMVIHRQFAYAPEPEVGAPLGRCCWVWCPGCDMAHRVCVVGEDGSRDEVIWEWDGNMERPTFSPSILLTTSNVLLKCHSFIRDGQWQFLGDCSHALAGQTVDMVPLPDWLVHESIKEPEAQ